MWSVRLISDVVDCPRLSDSPALRQPEVNLELTNKRNSPDGDLKAGTGEKKPLT